MSVLSSVCVCRHTTEIVCMCVSVPAVYMLSPATGQTHKWELHQPPVSDWDGRSPGSDPTKPGRGTPLHPQALQIHLHFAAGKM